MKFSVALVVALALSAGYSALAAVKGNAHREAGDLKGWTNTRWGMTLEDLRKVQPRVTIGVDYFGLTAGKLPDVTIGDSTLQVFLDFKGVGGSGTPGIEDPQQPEWRLSRVELMTDVRDCSRLTEALTAKYGKPSQSEPDYHLWIFPTTTVRQVISLIKGGADKCFIIYHPTVRSDNL